MSNTDRNVSAAELLEAMEASRLCPTAYRVAADWALSVRFGRVAAMQLLGTLSEIDGDSPLWWGALDILESERTEGCRASKSI